MCVYIHPLSHTEDQNVNRSVQTRTNAYKHPLSHNEVWSSLWERGCLYVGKGVFIRCGKGGAYKHPLSHTSFFTTAYSHQEYHIRTVDVRIIHLYSHNSFSYAHNHSHTHTNTPFSTLTTIPSPLLLRMGWLRLVGSLKLQVSFAEYRLFRALLQKRPTILRSLLVEASPYPPNYIGLPCLRKSYRHTQAPPFPHRQPFVFLYYCSFPELYITSHV